MKAQFLEAMAGTVALLCGVTGAFLFAAGVNSSLAIFLLISSLILLCAAAVLMLRLHWYNTALVSQLYAQLLPEQRYRLRACGSRSLSPAQLIDLLGNHIREQQVLLEGHFAQNLFDDENRLRSLSESENTLRLLQAELQALQDQYDTDLKYRH